VFVKTIGRWAGIVVVAGLMLSGGSVPSASAGFISVTATPVTASMQTVNNPSPGGFSQTAALAFSNPAAPTYTPFTFASDGAAQGYAGITAFFESGTGAYGIGLQTGSFLTSFVAPTPGVFPCGPALGNVTACLTVPFNVTWTAGTAMLVPADLGVTVQIALSGIPASNLAAINAQVNYSQNGLPLPSQSIAFFSETSGTFPLSASNPYTISLAAGDTLNLSGFVILRSSGVNASIQVVPSGLGGPGPLPEVPEPASLSLLVVGALGLVAGYAWRRQKR
jgi:hypothetical protein